MNGYGEDEKPYRPHLPQVGSLFALFEMLVRDDFVQQTDKRCSEKYTRRGDEGRNPLVKEE